MLEATRYAIVAAIISRMLLTLRYYARVCCVMQRASRSPRVMLRVILCATMRYAQHDMFTQRRVIIE